MRYRLRTLLILLAIGPPMVGWVIWPRVREAYVAWRAEQMKSAEGIKPAGGGVATITGSQRIVSLQSLRAQQTEAAWLETQIKLLELKMLEMDRDSSNASMRLAALEAERLELKTRLSQVPKPLIFTWPIETLPVRRIDSPEVERAMLHDGMLQKY
jgi:hypothetical protein